MRNCPRLEKPSGSLPSTTSIFVFVILHSPKSAKISFRKCFVELFSNAYHNHKKSTGQFVLGQFTFRILYSGENVAKMDKCSREKKSNMDKTKVPWGKKSQEEKVLRKNEPKCKSSREKKVPRVKIKSPR